MTEGIQATLLAIIQHLDQLEWQQVPAQVPPTQPRPITATAWGPDQGQDVAPLQL